MSPFAKKIQWVVLLLIEERPGELVWRDIARTTGFNEHACEDAIHDLWIRGVVDVLPDSKLAPAGWRKS